MGSILTNNGAMVALQTLKSISKNLGGIQDQISTGKKISTAKDNAAVWAISTVMESDVASFKSISDSLALGSSTVGTALDATTQIKDKLIKMKEQIVSAQSDGISEENKTKIQAEIGALRDGIKSIVGAAQFNGLNFLKGTESVDFLASLDRSGTGNVTAASISVDRKNLESTDSTRGTTAEVIATPTTTRTENDMTLGAVATTSTALTFSTTNALEATDTVTFNVTVGNSTATFSYTGGTGSPTAVVDELTAAFSAWKTTGTGATQAPSSGGTYDHVTLTLSGAGSDIDDFDDVALTDNAAGVLTVTNSSTTTSVATTLAADETGGSTVSGFTATGSGTSTTAVATAGSAQITIGGTPAANETVTIGFGSTNVSYVVAEGDDVDAVAAGLQAAIDAEGLTGVTASNTNGQIDISNTSSTGYGTLTSAITGSQQITVDDSTLSAVSGNTKDSGTATFKAGSVSEGNSYRMTVGSENFDYVARDGDTMNDVVANLAGLVQTGSTNDVSVSYTSVDDPETDSVSITVTNNGDSSLALSTTYTTGGTVGGGLEHLDDIGVSDKTKASGSLAIVEGLLNKVVDAAAQFGADQNRIDSQKEFISKLTDSMKSGIGSLVDADMEEASARLQALQVQQQLGTQALSIANQAPQNVLSLFR